MNNTKNRAPIVADPDARAALSKIKSVVGYYLGLCVVTLVALYLLRDHHNLVNDAAWTRGIIVTASAVLTYSFAARGNAKGLLRLRIVSIVMIVAIAVIISVHGTFPTWLKVEQAVCGLLLLRIAVLANGKRVRSYFASR
ncbi:hypothetical protein QQY66_00240 [Streptomyces sp. DG2A-72]|uniref:hypothetical protein n=1 Tax=Streptomyces sp. DG2A-72 TaxID=3051386 RepID=UPI00265C1D5E|nr:hypothetical protein [Streptomyces sp. DG2A-72]MDO0930221.1 hypothetical protein [Streptomyces sp. DG2A-72]